MRRTRERKPRNQRGQLLVLRPWGANQSTESNKATTELISFQLKSVRRSFEQFAFFSCERLQATALASVKQRFAKELSVSGVNQRMRRQNLWKIRKRLSGGK